MSNKEEIVQPQVIQPVPQKDTDHAFAIYTEILQRRAEVARNFIELGRLFKEVRDKDLHKFLDYESFQDFLGSIGFRRSTVYSYIHVYELYIEKLKLSPDFLMQIPYRRLQEINPVVESNPEEWLYKAKELSESDLITEIRAAQNLPIVETPNRQAGASTRPTKPKPFNYESYEKFLKAYGCATCESKECEGAHFPKTEKAGAPDHWKIPLCRKCHSTYHQDPIDFLMTYRDQIFGFFYEVISSLYHQIIGEKLCEPEK